MALLAACGDDDSSDGSNGIEYFLPGGVSERTASERGEARLSLDHTAVLMLEAAGGHPGDTGVEDGVDELSYHFAVPTEIRLSLKGFDETPRLTVIDALGSEVARVDGDTGDVTVTLSGHHTFRFEHPRAGDPSAEPILIFFRPRFAAADAEQALGAVQPAASDAATLEAGKDCVRCNLKGLVWDACPGATLKGVNLSHSDFSSASLTCLNIESKSGVPTLLTGANFQDAILAQSLLSGADLTDANFAGASFNVTTFDGVTATGADFSDSRFASATFGASSGTGSSARAANFSGAMIQYGSCLSTYDLRDADFSGAYFDDQSSVHGTWFAGANLFNATFDGTKFQYDSSLSNCGKPSSCSTVTVSGLCSNCPCRADLGCLTLAGTKYCAQNLGPVTLSEPAQCERAAERAADGITVQNANLENVAFSGADLTNSTFAANTLDGSSDFSGTELAGVDFTQQDLGKGVDFSKAFLSIDTDFTGTVLTSPSTQQGVILSCDRDAGTGACEFASGTTQFKGADLQYAQLNNVGLAEADLGGAVLDNAELVGADLNLASLKGVSLKGATLGTAPGAGGAASLRGAYMINADLTDTDMRSVDFTGAHLYGADTDALFVNAKLDSADFTDAILAGAVFTNASLTATVFDGAQLANADFDGATLTNAKFDNAYLQGADFTTAASITGISLSNAGVSTTLTSSMCTLTPPGTWTFMEQDGTPYTFAYGATALQTDGTVVCPNNDFGPCDSADSLCPISSGPQPPIPTCVPIEDYCWENCLTPPCYLDTPDPDTGLCPLISNCD